LEPYVRLVEKLIENSRETAMPFKGRRRQHVNQLYTKLINIG
jgi:hypothetical protein